MMIVQKNMDESLPLSPWFIFYDEAKAPYWYIRFLGPLVVAVAHSRIFWVPGPPLVACAYAVLIVERASAARFACIGIRESACACARIRITWYNSRREYRYNSRESVCACIGIISRRENACARIPITW